MWLVVSMLGHLFSLVAIMCIFFLTGILWLINNTLLSLAMGLVLAAVYGLLDGFAVGTAQGMLLRHYTKLPLLEEWALGCIDV